MDCSIRTHDLYLVPFHEWIEKKICFPSLVPSQTQLLFCFWNLLFSKVYIIHKVNLIWSYVLVTKTEATDSQREFYIATWLSCKYINSTLHIWFIVIRIKCPTQIHGYICVCDLSNRHKLACSCFILTIWTHLCPSLSARRKTSYAMNQNLQEYEN